MRSYHALARPDACEAEAVFRMAMLAKMAGDAKLYVVHLSSGLGLEAIEERTIKANGRCFFEKTETGFTITNVFTA